MKYLTLFLICLCFLTPSFGKGKKYDVTEFVAESFAQAAPPAKAYSLNEADKKIIKKILSHKLKQSRFRYWRKGNRFVWVLNEIGKYEPITAAYIVDEKKIEAMKVLVFRESRGWEVQKTFYSKRFKNISLKKNYKLNKRISNISGATLSVRATTKMARIALYLSQQIMDLDPHVLDNASSNEEATSTL